MITILAMLALARPAHACLCGSPDPEFFPADGAAGVATSAQPVVVLSTNPDPASVALTTADGVPVAVAVEQREQGAQTAAILHPVEPLSPDTTYIVTARDLYVASFTTGAESDKAAPALPTLLSAEGSVTGAEEACPGEPVMASCGPYVGASLSFAEDGDAWRVEALVTTEDGASGAVSSVDGALRLGQLDCRFNFYEVSAAETLTVQWRAVDASGNASEWSEPVDVALPWPEPLDCPDEKAGCNASAGAGGALASLLAALAAGRRRRR